MANEDERALTRAIREAGDNRVTIDDFTHVSSFEGEDEPDEDSIAVVLETREERQARIDRAARRRMKRAALRGLRK